MKKLKQIWLRLNSSLWFLPTLMVTSAVALALGLIEVGARLDTATLARFPRLFGAGAEGSRGMLSAIAGSMISIAGTTFSITIVALALASSQYTPRILRNFMRDRTNQFVLGFFVGVFAYCIVVLRTIRGGDEVLFIPSLAVLGGIILALASVGVLIFFIHHIATSIQANTIIAHATRETIDAVRKLFPTELGEAAENDAPEPADGAAWQPIAAAHSGYLQDVDHDGLLNFARERDAIVRMEHGIGEFVVEKSALVSARVAAQLGEADKDALRAFFSVGDFRTSEQDAAFGIRQIVDIALKALSPGINDTTTAVTCVEHLGAVLATVVGQRFESTARSDGKMVRVLARGPTFTSLTAGAFDQIRSSSEGNVAVLISLLRAQGTVAQISRHTGRRATLRVQVELVAEVVQRSLATAYERSQAEAELARARAALDASSITLPQ